MVEDRSRETTQSPSQLLEFHALGALFVRLNGVELKLSPAAQRLLIYLAIKGPAIDRSTLAGVLYSESSEVRAQGNLRTLVSRTKLKVPDHLVSDRNEVRLNGRFWVDANDVDTGDLLSLRFRWRGAFLEDHGAKDTLYDEWVRRKRVRIEQRFTTRLHAAMSQAEELRDWARCRELAHFLTDFEPWSEAGFRGLLRATHETSGPASARALYERFTTRLQTEAGAEPTAETVALADTLLSPRPDVSRRSGLPRPRVLAEISPPDAPEPAVGNRLVAQIDPSVQAALHTRALEDGVVADEIIDTALRRYLKLPGPRLSDPRTRNVDR